MFVPVQMGTEKWLATIVEYENEDNNIIWYSGLII